MTEHSTKRLYFFDYLGDECEVPETYYYKYSILLDPISHIYKLEEQKREWYGF